MNEDFRDLLAALASEEVRFLVVGAHALAVHGFPRATGDLDVWIERTPENADRAWRALRRFGAPVEELGVSRGDFSVAGTVVQLGVPPRRIDLLTSVTGLEFAEAWNDRLEVDLEGLRVPFLGRASLVRNKRATGRPKDRLDADLLEGTVDP